MQINFDCSTFFIRDSRLLVNAFDVDPLYLKHDKQGQIPDYRVSSVSEIANSYYIVKDLTNIICGNTFKSK